MLLPHMAKSGVIASQGIVRHFPSLILLMNTFSNCFISYLMRGMHSFITPFDSLYVHSPLSHSFKLQEPLGLWFYHIILLAFKNGKDEHEHDCSDTFHPFLDCFRQSMLFSNQEVIHPWVEIL